MASDLAELVTAEAFHNLDARFGPYEPGHRVVRVFVGKFDDPGNNDIAVCNTVFELLNVGHEPEFTNGDPDIRAVAYRERENRSLSVGDIVTIQRGTATQYYAVASRGFTTIAKPTIVGEAAPGTMPL
jgi:hypothetical protein